MYIKKYKKDISNKKGEFLAMIGNIVLGVVFVYFIGIVVTLFGVAMGGISAGDGSVWSEHIRSVVRFIIG